MNITMKNLPVWAKALISILPSVILAVLAVFLLIMPKQEEIKRLDKKIDDQNNKIAAAEAKAARLEVLMQENERLLRRLEELKEQLPEESEISNLLKQVSDLGIGSGLDIKSWKPSPRSTHASGIVYEIPVSVQVTGTYHNLGYFLSSLTRLNRIVNISDMRLGGAKREKGENELQVSFTASTFTAVPEAEVPGTGN